jgi:methyl-accepting chemotaxis protein
MKNATIKMILITIILGCLTVSAGCTYSFRLEASKAGTLNNGQTIDKTVETGIVEADYTKEKEKLLRDTDLLAEGILKADGAESIKAVLENYYKVDSSSVICVYYAGESGEFYIFPNQELIKDYDARTRPWYKQATENKIYVSQCRDDVVSGKIILTAAKSIIKNNGNTGVVGVDRFAEN